MKFSYTTIKTFEDACLKLGVDPTAFYQKYQGFPDHIKALIKLEVITKALNDGWENPIDGETLVYYPWFWLYSDREAAALTEAERNDERIFNFIKADGSAGLGFALSYLGWSLSLSLIGSRLACKSSDIASYCAVQFKDMWASYLYPQIQQMEVQSEALW